MTINKEQGKALFGETAAWEMTFVARPASPSNLLDALIRRPEASAAADFAIKSIFRERRTNPARPTRCLLCDRNFLHQLPAGLVIMTPATRKGPSAGFALCDDCVAIPDLETRVRAYLHAKLGAQETRWGTA